MMPEDVSLFRIKAKHIAPFGDREHAIAFHSGRRTGTSLVELRVELRRITVLPNFFPALCIEAPNRILLVRIPNRVNLPWADCEGREAGTDRSSPKDRRPFSRPIRAHRFSRHS